ncbi:MAG TPA: SRPBCC family protein [Gemmatimonadales bacterium]|nr:SRPBCC family protein [Gemmatimonadales bacterium]
MASIYREIRIDAPPELVWDALRDVGALHRRLARGFVTDVRLEEGARVVTLANGIVARELIVAATTTLQPRCFRTAEMEAGSCGSPTCCVAISAMMDQGLVAIRRTLEDGRSAG